MLADKLSHNKTAFYNTGGMPSIQVIYWTRADLRNPANGFCWTFFQTRARKILIYRIQNAQ
jgi:hypothetical protein